MSAPTRAGTATLGRRDTLRFNATQTVPQLLRGTFTQRPGMASFLARKLSDPQGIRLITELRRRYDSDYLWLKMAGKSSLLVLNPDGVRSVLDASPDVYGPPDLKVRGMSHFQPGAVTISTGDDWKRRRAFNDEVLGGGAVVHPRARDFLRQVTRVVDPVLQGRSEAVSWSVLRAAFRSMTGTIVFGEDTDAEPVLSRLDLLMKRANRIVPSPDADAVAAFQHEIRERIRAPRAGGLAAASCPHLHAEDSLPVAGQVPHWLFAMKGTLAINCGYALALIAADPEVQRQVRAEVEGVDLSDPDGVDGLTYVEGCLRDAMRLWPTTPLIVRLALRDAEVEGRRIGAGEQVIIHNGFNHRHPDLVADPDRFRPEAWERGVLDYRFNALSNGPQACAGRELVHFLGKAVLARFFQRHRWTLSSPALRAEGPIPHAFDHTALVLGGVRD